MASAVVRDELTCSICTDIYTDPVALTCGHSFCQFCITKTWDNQEERKYSCPECRQRFRVRPELKRNLRLCNLAKIFHSTNPQQEDINIFCHDCIHQPVPAIKTCLHCEISLCYKHLRQHSRSSEHVLAEPTTFFGNRKCSFHKKTLEYYCAEDTTCICWTCRSEELHKGHHVETLSDAFQKKKEELSKELMKLILRKKETGKKLTNLRQHGRDVARKVVSVTERVAALIRDTRKQLDNLEERVLSEISSQERQISLRISKVIPQLERKNEELSREISRIEELCNATDPLYVLNKSNYCGAKKEDVKVRENEEAFAVGDLNVSMISVILHTGLADIAYGVKRQRDVLESSNILRDVDAPLGTASDGNAVSDIVLDVNTAANNVSVSYDLKTVSWTIANQNRPETQERFQFNQVLSSNVFSSGQHYWIVEGSEFGDWRVGVAYPSIDRKGDQTLIGDNKKSWCLWKWDNQYTARHGKEITVLPYNLSSEGIGIFLDYDAGQISFHELCKPVKHLHTFTTRFSEPLCAVLGVWTYSFIRIKSSV